MSQWLTHILGILSLVPVIGWLSAILFAPIVCLLGAAELRRHRTGRRLHLTRLLDSRESTGPAPEGLDELFRPRRAWWGKPWLPFAACALIVSLPFVMAIVQGRYWTYALESILLCEGEFGWVGGVFYMVCGGLFFLVLAHWIRFQTGLRRNRREEITACASLGRGTDWYERQVEELGASWRGFGRIVRNVALILIWPAAFPFVQSAQLRRHYAWEKENDIWRTLSPESACDLDERNDLFDPVS